MQEAATHTFVFPDKAYYGKKIAKEKIYQFGSITSSLKKKFVQQIDRIVWQYKLAPETINIPASKNLTEIQVIDIQLKMDAATDLDETLLTAIDRAISMPLYYRIFAGEQIRFCMAFKRPSEADSRKQVVGSYFATAWSKASRTLSAAQPLPVALNMQKLYEYLLRSVIAQPARTGESLAEQVTRLVKVRHLTHSLEGLNGQLVREKQFNRQIDINREINKLRAQLQALQ